MPGNGKVAEPGLSAVIPGRGVIRIAPVSVCHQVSTIGQRSPPMYVQYQTHASGLIGSPTDPSSRSDDRSCFSGNSVPQRMNARIAVGAVYRIVARYFSTISHSRSLSGQSGAPSYMIPGGVVRERAVHDVGVAGDPTDVGRAPEHVVLVDVEDHPVRRRHLSHVPAGRVHDPLRLAGRPARVQQVEQVLGVHRLGRALGRLLRDQLVVPVVTTLVERVLSPGPTHRDHVLDRRTLRERLVGVGLERDDGARDGNPRRR